MPTARHSYRVDTLELKHQIERKLGHEKAEKYFHLLKQYLSCKLSKLEFDKLCIGVMGRENICLHNRLLRAIIRNAFVKETSPAKDSKSGISLDVKFPNGYQRGSLQSLCREVFPQSPRRGRTPNLRDRKLRDRPSPLGPHGKSNGAICEDSVPKFKEQQSAADRLSIGSRPPAEVNSVEEGEEVEQTAGRPTIYCRSPVRAPFGISINGKQTRKVLHSRSTTALCINTCLTTGELPDTVSLKARLEQNLEIEGFNISMDCVNLLNSGLDVYLKRLIQPSLELAGSRMGNKHHNEAHKQVTFGLNGIKPLRYLQKSKRPIFASFLDFQVTMESNPTRLGEDWPVQLEKIGLHSPDQD